MFSRIGLPLFHRYRVISHLGTHGAFRGSYMRRLHAFLEDATSLRRRHRRCAQDLAARMLRTSLRDTEDRTADVSPRPKVTGRWGAGSSRTTGSARPHRSEATTVQALMDLALPRFEGLGDGPRQVHKPWKISAESPASPDMSSVEDRRRSSSPCLNLDKLSSSDDDTGGSVRLSDLTVTLLCSSDDDHTPVNSDQVLSDVDLPPESVSNDKRQVIRIRDVSPDVQIVDVSQVGRAWDSRWTVSRGGSGKRIPLPLCIPAGILMLLRDHQAPIRPRWLEQ